jgi:hypothetical protein
MGIQPGEELACGSAHQDRALAGPQGAGRAGLAFQPGEDGRSGGI